MKKILLIAIPLVLAAALVLTFIYMNRPMISGNRAVEKPAERAIPEKTPVESPAEIPVEIPAEEPEKVPVPEEGPRDIVKIAMDNVLSMEIETGELKLTLEKENGTWTVNRGAVERIDQEKLNKVLEGFLAVRSVKTLKGEDDAAEATEKITIKTSGETTTLYRGKLKSDSASWYLKIGESGKLYLISGSAGEALSLELDDVRDRKIDLFNAGQIQSLTISNGSLIRIVPFSRYDMFTADKYRFMMEEPYRAYVPVGEKEISILLGKMTGPLIIDKFIDSGSREDYGITDSSRKLTVVEKSGKTFELNIGKDSGDASVYASLKGEKQIFTLKKASLPFLTIKPFDLADKIPQLIDFSKIASFTVTTGDLAVLCDKERRNGSTVYVVNGAETDKEKFTALFDRAINIPITGDWQEGTLPSKAYAVLAFQLNDGGTLWNRISFFSDGGEKMAVVKNDDAPLFFTTKSQVAAMIRDITTMTDGIMGF